MKMISTSDNSSSEEEDSQELQRLKDAAVTLEPSGDLHASQTISTNISGANKEANNTKECSRPSLRPSLRPKQTYSEDPCELKMTPGFKTHVAKKLSDILDKELEFSESAVEKSNENESSDSGIRLLSSSKDFLSTVPNADIPNLKKDSKWSPVWKPKSHAKLSSREKHASSVSRKRTVTNNNKETNSSSEKHGSSSSDSSEDEDERFLEAAISFQDIKKKDELLSSFATPSVPILIIQTGKDGPKVKDGIKRDGEEVGAGTDGSPVKKKKKKKKHCKEKKENLLDREETEDREKEEITRRNEDNGLCNENHSLEDNQIIPVKKKKKKKKNKHEKDYIEID